MPVKWKTPKFALNTRPTWCWGLATPVSDWPNWVSAGLYARVFGLCLLLDAPEGIQNWAEAAAFQEGKVERGASCAGSLG